MHRLSSLRKELQRIGHSTDHNRKELTVMEPIPVRKQFNKRAFLAAAMCMSALFLPVSGFMNHALQSAPWSTARHFWMAIHNMSALLFSIVLLWHVMVNRKALGRYVRSVPARIPGKEALLGAAVVVGAVGIFSLHAFQQH